MSMQCMLHACQVMHAQTAGHGCLTRLCGRRHLMKPALPFRRRWWQMAVLDRTPTCQKVTTSIQHDCSTSIIHESLTSGMRCSQPGCRSRQDKAALVLRHLHAVWASFVLTHGCPGVLSHPPQPTMANARKEAEMVLFDSVGDVLRETNLRPRNVRLYTISK